MSDRRLQSILDSRNLNASPDERRAPHPANAAAHLDADFYANTTPADLNADYHAHALSDPNFQR